MTQLYGARYLESGIVQIDELPKQRLPRGHVRIEPAFVGLCGTDAHILHGHMDSRVRRGTVLGHEMSGYVTEVSTEDSRVAIGDLVTVRPVVPCNECAACRSGHGNVCGSLRFLGIDADGALQSEWVVPSMLVHIANGLAARRVALTEPLAVAVHDVQRSRLGRGDNCLVVGAGPIGVLIALVATSMGAKPRLVDVSPYRVSMAQELGLLAGHIHEVDPGTYDVAFEVSGTAAGINLCLTGVRPRGTITIVGIQTSAEPLSLFPAFWKETTIIGARLYTPDDFEKALEILRDPTFPAETLITDEISLDEVAGARTIIDNRECLKVLVELEKIHE